MIVTERRPRRIRRSLERRGRHEAGEGVLPHAGSFREFIEIAGHLDGVQHGHLSLVIEAARIADVTAHVNHPARNAYGHAHPPEVLGHVKVMDFALQLIHPFAGRLDDLVVGQADRPIVPHHLFDGLRRIGDVPEDNWIRSPTRITSIP